MILEPKKIKSDTKEVYYEKRWLEEAQAGIKTDGKNINNLRYADDITLMAEVKKN